MTQEQKTRLASITDRLAEVSEWMEIPDEISAGINSVISDLNQMIDE